MDWLFYLLDIGLFIVIVAASVIFGLAGGIIIVKFLGAKRYLLRYGFPLVTSLVAFVLGSRLAFLILIAGFPAGRWLNLLLAAMLFPLLAPLVLEAFRYTRRELRN